MQPIAVADDRAQKVRIYNAKYYAANPDRGRDRSAEKAAYHQRRGKELKAARIKARAELVNAEQAKRRARKLQACPSWANHDEIKSIYKQAKEQGLVVDHVIPLLGKLVCGLHVENNLQLLTASENLRKGNKFEV